MLRKGKLARRALVSLAASAALVGTVGVGPAAASDDWEVGHILAHDTRVAKSSIHGAYVSLMIGWDGYSVQINGTVDDTAADGRSAEMEIRYQVYYSGAWHTHYRYPGKASGSGAETYVGPYVNRYPVRSVVARACTSDNGSIVSCDSWR